MSAPFTPSKVRDVAFRNRVVMPPMVMNFGDAHGHVTEQVLAHYGARADAGAFKGYFDTNTPIAQWVRQFTTLPIITAGGLGDPRLADRVIADGIADFAAVGHGLLDDPEWTKHAAETLGNSPFAR